MHNIADFSFHVVGLHVRAVSVFGKKNQMKKSGQMGNQMVFGKKQMKKTDQMGNQIKLCPSRANT